MASPSSPHGGHGDMDPNDKSRVLVEGPGTTDTKQGAKIACLECRSAKIKCSAPTDGEVPCKRCVKHRRECLFEKHKRGRKPNKRFSVPSDLRAEMHNESASYSPQRDSYSDVKMTAHDGRSASDDDESGDISKERHRYEEGGTWKPPIPYVPTAPTRSSQYAEDRYHHSSIPTYGQPGPLPISMSAPSGLNQATHAYAYPSSQSHAAHHHHTSHPSYPSGRHPSDVSSPNRWREHSLPHTSSPRASQPPPKSYASNDTSTHHDNFSQARSRSYVNNGPAPSHSYAQWDSQLASERALKARLEMSPSRHPDSSQQRSSQQVSSQFSRADEGRAKNTNPLRSSSNARTTNSRTATGRHTAYHPDVDEDMEEEQDELEDDADATREEHDNVLSNPLKLLAQASDAAAARIEGGRIEHSSRSSLAAVETMGLLHPSMPSSRMAVSAAVNRTGLGRPLYGRREEDTRSQRGWPASRVLPPIMLMGKSNESSDPAFDQLGPPSFLKDNARSKSSPAGELPRLDAASNAEDDHADTPSARTTSTSKASGLYLGRSNALTPSTLDHDAWEYREGKAQARRGYGSGASPGGLSGDAVTTGSSTSAGALPTYKNAAVSAINGVPSGEVIESPAEEVTTAMLGKRKRGRSRIARASRKRLAEWDTDAENADGGDDEAADQPKSKQVTIEAGISSSKDAGGITSGGEGESGASRKGYFNLSLFHSKNDDTEGIDPVELGLVELKELERLFDIFFARINPVLDLFDPFLHSVAFVRMRSAFLTTVISCMAARFSDTPQDAHIASVLDKHWQEKLLPMILLGGYKSVEISQAFLILTTYSRPTNRLVDDRSWQYLGFAIRTATEVGVNRRVTPSQNLLGNEQVARRVRNRERLWYNLFLYDRTLSAQTGRPWTITEDRMIVQSSMWHRQDFALPEDVSLVSLIKLRRVTAQHTEAFDTYLSSADRVDEVPTASAALGVEGQSHFDRRLAGLEFFRKMANADLEKWKETWCINTEEKSKEVDTSTAAGKYLIRWAPTAKLFYYHSRLLINSLVLGATEQYEDFLSGSSVSVDCWTSAISLIDTVLNDFPEESVVTWSNDRVVMAVYAAVSSVRMTNLQHKYAFADKETLLSLVRRLAVSMTQAGKTPRHRNGSATPYGRYLKSVLAAFETKDDAARGATARPDTAASAADNTPGKDSEEGVTNANSSLTPGDSLSAGATPSVALASRIEGQSESQDAAVLLSTSNALTDAGKPNVFSMPAISGMNTSNISDARQLQPDDVVAQIGAGKTLDVPLIMTDSNAMGLGSQGQSGIGTVHALGTNEEDSKLMARTSLNSASDMTTVASTAPGVISDKDDGLLSINMVTPSSTGRPSSSISSNSGGAPVNLPPNESSLLLSNSLTPVTTVLPSQPVGTSVSAPLPAFGTSVASQPNVNVVDDPESLERMWDYMTSFEHTSFWQPQSTWNMSGVTTSHSNHSAGAPPASASNSTPSGSTSANNKTAS